MCFNWKLNSCIICKRYMWSSINVCNKCRYIIYDYTFHNKNSFTDFNEYKNLR